MSDRLAGPSDRLARLLCRLGGPVAVALGLALLLAAPSSATATAATASPAPAAGGGSIGLRLLDAPTSARGDPRAQVYVVDHLAPGAVIERRIEVSNTTDAPVSVRLYPAAASIEDGSFLGAAGDTPNDLSTWTTVDPGTTEVPSDGTVQATVTISVPVDAAPGEQYGVVWAEARSAPAEGGVTQVSRVGIRLYVSVGPGGAPAADFTIEALTAGRAADGEPVVLATVRNTGGRALDMNGTLTLGDGPGGLSAGPFPATLGSTLAIGSTQPVRIALDEQLPAGPWDAEITLRSGLVERTATATLTFPDVGTAAAVPTTDPRPWWIYPVVAVLSAMSLLGAVLIRHVLRRRRSSTPSEPGPRHGRTTTRTSVKTLEPSGEH